MSLMLKNGPSLRKTLGHGKADLAGIIYQVVMLAFGQQAIHAKRYLTP